MNFWKILKMFFCKHDYTYYYREAYYDDSYSRCTKCGHVKFHDEEIGKGG